MTNAQSKRWRCVSAAPFRMGISHGSCRSEMSETVEAVRKAKQANLSTHGERLLWPWKLAEPE